MIDLERGDRSDTRIRDLQRAVAEGDEGAHDLLRVELLRAGKEVPLEVGDLVLVEEEVGAPYVAPAWIGGKWRGLVVRVFPAGDAYVRPLAGRLEWKIRPGGQDIKRGIYLTNSDRKELVALRGTYPKPRFARGRKEST